jgi:chromosomal replication initiation ATPase DnaA
MKKYDIKLNDYCISLIVNSIDENIKRTEKTLDDIKRYAEDQETDPFDKVDQYFIEKLSRKIIELKDIKNYLLG